jgi:large subunit ribosomal protein L25
MPALSLETTPRTSLGRKNKALRRSGLTPLHLYGPGGDPLILQAPSPVVRKLLVSAGKTTAVNIAVEGTDGEELSFVRDVAVHPVTGEIQHVDFLRIHADRKVQIPVEVTLVGEAPATRGGAAQINHVTRSLLVLAFPLNVPSGIEADITALEEIGDVLRVSDLVLPDDVEAAAHPDDVVARAQKQREVEVFEIVGGEADVEGVEGEEGVGGEEGAEGEEGAADGESSFDERA